MIECYLQSYATCKRVYVGRYGIYMYVYSFVMCVCVCVHVQCMYRTQCSGKFLWVQILAEMPADAPEEILVGFVLAV